MIRLIIIIALLMIARGSSSTQKHPLGDEPDPDWHDAPPTGGASI
jgi:hypothetical protein